MRLYRCIGSDEVSVGGIVLTTIQDGEIEKVRMWRNQQIDVLRQKVEISKKEQIQYFRDKVWPDLDSNRPNQILLSIYQDGTHIGYGGLVHISWEDSRAEVSFLLDPRIDETGNIFTDLFKNFLAGIEKIATENLKLHKLVLETYSFRVNHIAVIEDSGFTREGLLADQVSVNGEWFNSILHGKILRENTIKLAGKRFNNLKNVLVTSSSSKVPLIRSLKKTVSEIGQNFQIVAGDSDKRSVSKYAADRFWEMPLLEDAFLGEILSKSLDLNLGLIIPTRDGELAFWARNQNLFREHDINVLISDTHTVDVCLDKLEFYKFMQANGFKSVETFRELPYSESNAKFVVKERYGSGSKGLGLNLSLEAARKFAAILEDPIFQPMIEGSEISADIWIIPNVFESVVLRSRDLIRNGESQVTTIFFNPDLEDTILDIAKKLGIVGAAVIQVIIDASGTPFVLECNARIGGASTASIAAGSGGFLNLFKHYILAEKEIKSDFVQRIKPLTQIRYTVDEYRFDTNL